MIFFGRKLDVLKQTADEISSKTGNKVFAHQLLLIFGMIFKSSNFVYARMFRVCKPRFENCATLEQSLRFCLVWVFGPLTCSSHLQAMQAHQARHPIPPGSDAGNPHKTCSCHFWVTWVHYGQCLRPPRNDANLWAQSAWVTSKWLRVVANANPEVTWNSSFWAGFLAQGSPDHEPNQAFLACAHPCLLLLVVTSGSDVGDLSLHRFTLFSVM